MSRPTIIKRDILDTRSLVVLAPHPDDESLGCGLLIADAVARGIRVTVVVLTDGQASHPASVRWPPKRLGRLRRSETRRALGRLGAAHVAVHFMGWQDGHLARDAKPLRLRRLLAAVGCRTILVASPADFHPDHRAAFDVAKLLVDRNRRLFAYRVWSRVGVAQVGRTRHGALAQKRWAAAAYRSQIGPYIADDPGGFTFDGAALRQLLDGAEVFDSVGPARRPRARPDQMLPCSSSGTSSSGP